MSKHGYIDLRILMEYVEYEKSSGKLFWKKSPNFRAPLGSEVGSLTCNNYRAFQLFGVKIQVHRAIYAIYHGDWPRLEVDHINGDRTDNRISNLRQPTSAENKQNSLVARNPKQGSLIGASWHASRKKWRAVITINGKSMHLGYFDSRGDVHACYLKEKSKIHPAWAGLPGKVEVTA